MDLETRIARFRETDLYVVITESFCSGRHPLNILEQVLAAGVRTVQFREKGLSDRDLYQRALAFRDHTREAGALLIVDDRLDLALAVGADGVHLGQTDLPVPVARRIAPDLIIGASSHSREQALTAQEAGASYVNIGPIFATQTKTDTALPLGVSAIEVIAPHLTVPFTVMGGIKLDNVDEVLRRGAKHVAVVTAVTAANNVRDAAEALRERIRALVK